MRTIRISLPIPHARLSPNARVHWRAKMTATRLTRAAARLCAVLEMGRIGWRSPARAATVQATFYFRQERSRDRDNLLAMLKSSFDGLADAGIIANDSGLTHLPVVVKKDSIDPRVELLIQETAA